jgi:hypothetical protein
MVSICVSFVQSHSMVRMTQNGDEKSDVLFTQYLTSYLEIRRLKSNVVPRGAHGKVEKCALGKKKRNKAELVLHAFP